MSRPGISSTSLPSLLTAYTAVVCFFVYSILLVVASRWPLGSMRVTLTVATAVFTLCIVLLLAYDAVRYIIPNTGVRYRKNLGNTVLSLVLSMVILTFAYWCKWHVALNRTVLFTQEETVASARFPSVAFFQRVDWSSQAILTREPAKCGLGWIETDGKNCTNDGTETPIPCRCDDNFSPGDVGNFTWQGVKYRYLDLATPSSHMCVNEGTEMIVQVFFYYNTNKAANDSSERPSPSLYIAIYDASLDLREALEKNFTRLMLFQANGQTAINLALRYREAVDGTKAYDYTLTISTVPAQTIQCEWDGVSALPDYKCFASVHLQFPSFDRIAISRGQDMSWSDVVMEAGGFMSFIILLSWAVSGLAFLSG
ncbi:uncharacterized protein PV09_07539 [Verruconis gallopava]|uniref:Uncharacterized protein n=1 Tax=Verruconis gallopava TaxID=253628 RepID=A0A0D2A2R9_9PEZI|nr:uncharacterized protein PV09_07539 [Verruconis gallopava]KIW01023.1 hypothetical protein PV09_07539 [Verruconis gallopava]